MQLQKASSYDGRVLIKLAKQVFFYLIGILGAVIVVIGYSKLSPSAYYVIGSVLLLTTAIYFKIVYFIALELILLAGHGAVLLGMGLASQVSVPIMLTIQMMFYYLLNGQLNNPFRIIGVIGIAIISIGFLDVSPLILLTGNICVASYSYYHITVGHRAAVIWFSLNLFFVFATAYTYFVFIS